MWASLGALWPAADVLQPCCISSKRQCVGSWSLRTCRLYQQQPTTTHRYSIVDNRHHGEDVIAGWLIGAVVAMAVFLHAAATVDDVVAACGGAGRASGGALQLSESGEGSDAGDTPLCSHACVQHSTVGGALCTLYVDLCCNETGLNI